MSKNSNKRNLNSISSVDPNESNSQDNDDDNNLVGGSEKFPKNRKKLKKEDNHEEDDVDYEFVEEDVSSDDDDYDDDMDQVGKNINVEFLAYDPNETDFHGIKCLLQQLWLKENIDLSELTELIIKDSISTVLKQNLQGSETFDDDDGNDEEEDEDEEDNENTDEDNTNNNEENNTNNNDEEENIFGVISLIPFSFYINEKQCLKQIKQTLLSYLPEDNQIRKKLQDSTKKFALVINERFANLPPKLSAPCFKQMLTELNNFQREKPKDKKFDFDFVIMIVKLSKYHQDILFTNAEEEIFCESSSQKFFDYSVVKQSDLLSKKWNNDDDDDDDDDEDDDNSNNGIENLFEPYRRILLLTKAEWLRTINVLEEVI